MEPWSLSIMMLDRPGSGALGRSRAWAGPEIVAGHVQNLSTTHSRGVTVRPRAVGPIGPGRAKARGAGQGKLVRRRRKKPQARRRRGPGDTRSSGQIMPVSHGHQWKREPEEHIIEAA